jgi:pilus assembly protein CpaB
MDRRFLTVLGVSLVFALVVSSIFYQMSSKAGANPKPQAQQVDSVDIVVAARPLNIGGSIKADDIKVIKIAQTAFPKGAFAKPEDVIDRPIISNILLDEPVLEGRLAPRGAGTGLAGMILQGMRAVSVRVNEVVGVAGFVLPGMHVDVLVTGRPPGETQATITKTVLQDITVLTAGGSVQADPRGQPINAPVVTLLVTPAQAEVLTLAGNEARIQLVLRNGADTSAVETKGTSIKRLYNITSKGNHIGGSKSSRYSDDDEDEDQPRPRPRPIAPAPIAVAALPPPPPPVPDSVVVIRGNQKSVEVIQGMGQTR